MDQNETWHGGRLGSGHIVLDGDPAPPKRGGTGTTQFSAHVRCGQTTGWTKMPLGMEVHLGSRDLVLDGDPVPPPSKKGGHRPQFSVHVYYGQTAGRLKDSKNVSVSAEQDLGLGLISWQKSDILVSSHGIAGRSWSRSRLRPKTECLGLVS